MKFSKIFAIGLAALTMTACSDDDNNMNSAQDVTVSLGVTTLEVDEDDNGSIYNIPVVVDGKANGNVKVTLEVTEQTAIEDVHFYVTSKTLTIGDTDKSVNFEFHPTGDDQVNEDRTFTVSIANVEGAQVGANTTCEVKLLDDDVYMLDVYPQLLGQYTFSATNQSSGAAVQQVWTMSGVEEGDAGYPHTAYITGIQGYAWSGFEAYLGYSPKAKRAWMRFEYGQTIAEEVDFGLGGMMDVKLCGYDGGVVDSGSETVNFSADLSTINFGASQFIGYIYLTGTDTPSGYLWFRWGGMTMTKAN